MNKIIIFISIFFLNYATSYAEVVKKFEVTGNKRVSEQTIKVYGEVEIGKNYSEADLNQVLQNIYSTNFFSDVKINLKNETLFIDVKEYPVVNQLILIGEESNRYKEEIKKLIKLKQKKSFIKSFLVNDVEIIKQLYSSLGYNDAKVEIKTKKNDEYNLDLVIEIDKGNLTRISSINFIGDKKIKDKRLREIIASEEDKFWKIISNNSKFSENLIQLDKRLLRNYYKSLGYYNVKINSSSAEKSKEGDINLVYSIDAGKRYTITKITTNADSIFDNQIFLSLKKSYNKYIGEYYSPFSIKDLLEDIDILIENNNLQFVEHNVEEILNDTNNSIEVIFNIFESQKILVERISIIGNNVTNEDVIPR